MNVLIGKNEVIRNIVDSWTSAAVIPLPQEYSMIWLTESLHDEVTGSLGIGDNSNRCRELCFFSSAISRLMEQSSSHSQLAYLETDYFGGVGTQGGVLFEDGAITIGPTSGEGTINRILKAIGVVRQAGKKGILHALGLRKNILKDEFDTLELGLYRQNPAD